MDLKKDSSYLVKHTTERVERPFTHKFVDGSPLLTIIGKQVEDCHTRNPNQTSYLDLYDVLLTLIADKRDSLWHLFNGDTEDEAHSHEYFRKRSQVWFKATDIVLEAVLCGRSSRDVTLSKILDEQLVELPKTTQRYSLVEQGRAGDLL